MSFIFLLYLVNPVLAAQANTDWQDAQAAYTAEDYETAINAFQKVLAEYPASVQAMYNLGNCYFLKGDLGRAILWYERGLRLKPHDSDLRHNLLVAKNRRENALIEIRPFFLVRWIKSASGLFSPLIWGILSLVCFWTLMATLIFSLLRNAGKRNTWIAGLSGVLFLCTGFLGYFRYSDLSSDDAAIVLTDHTAVLIAPEEQSKQIGSVGSGEKVMITDSLRAFYKVRLVNFEQGWIPVTAVEKIRPR